MAVLLADDLGSHGTLKPRIRLQDACPSELVIFPSPRGSFMALFQLSEPCLRLQLGKGG